jgi:hypothetical protein
MGFETRFSGLELGSEPRKGLYDSAWGLNPRNPPPRRHALKRRQIDWPNNVIKQYTVRSFQRAQRLAIHLDLRSDIMAFVSERQYDRSLARSAWDSPPKRAVP